MASASEFILRLLLSLAVSAFIGWEREHRGKPAGLQTHVMVGVGSTLFTIASLLIDSTDSTRIAAGIVTGIGFLGAGMIFKEKTMVLGLTSAAAVWATSAVGLAIGAGLYLPALVGAFIVVVTPFIPHKHHLQIADEEACHTCGRKLKGHH